MNLSYLNVASVVVGSFQQFRCQWFGLATGMFGLFLLPMAQAEHSAGDGALFKRLDANNDQRITTDELAADQHRLFERLLRRGDRDDDGTLSHEEFVAALVPSRPDKTLETKRPSSSPEANAVRWLLLTMDTNGNGWIEAAEVPEEFETTFESMEQRLDTDKNRILESGELIRGNRPLAQIARRVVRQNGVDVAAELKQLQRKQGAAANRFEERRGPLEILSDPERAGQLFAQLDANHNGRLEDSELPQSLKRPIRRLLRSADRDGDGQLSQREFVAGARRMAARRARQSAAEMTAPEAMSNESLPAER
jgi:Ca2+-binding EF-hand superfamily protein